MIVAFSVAPTFSDPEQGMAEAVAEAVRVVRESGLPNETNAMFTLVEGEWDEVMDVVKRATEAVSRVSPRTSLVIKADIRNGYTGQLRAKVDAVEDALKATDGEMFALTNAHARKARRLFLELEGVDIYSAAGIATASLIKAVEEGKIAKDAVVMLNITGGGELHFKEDKTLWYLKPDHVFPIDPDPEEVIAKTEALFA